MPITGSHGRYTTGDSSLCFEKSDKSGLITSAMICIQLLSFRVVASLLHSGWSFQGVATQYTVVKTVRPQQTRRLWCLSRNFNGIRDLTHSKTV